MNCYPSNIIKKMRLKNDIKADKEYEGVQIIPYTPQTLKLKDLEPGDIIFCRFVQNFNWYDLSKIQPKIIETFTAGYYSHCAIYLGDNTFIEATLPKVREITLEDLRDGYKYLAVTRINFSEENKENIIKYAKKQIGKSYNICGAILSPIREHRNVINVYNTGDSAYIYKNTASQKESKKFFCSELVMECIRQSGILTPEQLDMKYFHSNSRTPTGLAKYAYGDILKHIGYMAKNYHDIDCNDYFITNQMYPNID